MKVHEVIVTYEHGNVTAGIYRSIDTKQYYVLISYGRDNDLIRWYTKLSSAKRGLKRTLNDIAFSAMEINYKKAMDEAKGVEV